METKILHTNLIIKKQRLEQVKISLQEKFIGLDDVIDEVISLMLPWYLFPEAQMRPTIINLWGLTGSGKTALVQAIVELLDHKKLYSHLDMGEFESDSASWMKDILTNDLAFFDEKPALICLDEFQFAKTLDTSNNELGKDKLRAIWELLDSGKIEYLPGNTTYYLFRGENCAKRLEKAIRANVELSDGKIVNGLDEFIQIFKGFYFDYNDRSSATINLDYFMSDDFLNGMFHLFDTEAHSKVNIGESIKPMTLIQLLAFVKEGMNTRPATKTLDLSHALIFVLGNLDEAYAMSRSMNPDISADEFHEQTSRITIADIKKALRKRFRSEQIARLGNNHLIYKSFNSAQFRMLIRNELKRVARFVLAKFGWRLSFDESVVDIVYAEGVFPAQGTRPVLTTIKNLVESKISNLVVSILEYQLTIEEIIWKYNNGQFAYELKNNQNVPVLTINDRAKLKLENLRKSVDPELQAHTAVHEAGHAVLAALMFRIAPSVVVSRTASDMEGFCLVNFPKGPMTRETLRKDIVITLGGYVAEKMIFGVELTSSGVYSDIEEASRLANRAIRNFAMGSNPIYLAVENSQNEDAFFMLERYAGEAVALIKECEVIAHDVLTRNKFLLLKMSEYLTRNSRMEQPLISDYVIKYGKENWIKTTGLIVKEEYYSFNKTLQEQIEQCETENLQAEIDNIVLSKSQPIMI